MAKYTFNSKEVEPNSFDPIPAGKYVVVITESEFKSTKAGDGEYLALTLQVIEGEHKGRKLWDRLNLVNPSETAVKIARGQLSSICRAVGIAELNDTAQLHDKPLVARVSQRERDGSIMNDVKGYGPRENPAAAPVPTKATTASPAPAKSPWKKS